MTTNMACEVDKRPNGLRALQYEIAGKATASERLQKMYKETARELRNYDFLVFWVKDALQRSNGQDPAMNILHNALQELDEAARLGLGVAK